jgi:ribose transport system ATP-binding protein
MGSQAEKSLPYLLELKNISKKFLNIAALNSVNLSIRRGTIHALIGKNGAGKSTLTKIIAGVHSPTEGEILLEGKTRFFQTPAAAQASGISTLYQELTLLPELSVAENIFLGHEPEQSALRLINWKEIYADTQRYLKEIGFDINPEVRVGDLSPAQQQMVQIGRALKHNARLIVMDEPTARLTEYEVENLFKVICALREKGVTIVYISHRLEEIERICDYVTVLRDGWVVDTLEVRQTTISELSNLMLGRPLFEQFPKRDSRIGRELLRVQGLMQYGMFEDVDFALHSGEILGVTGLVGAGGTALLQAIFGLKPVDEGEIYVDHRLVQIRTPREAINLGIGLLSEDRQEEGLVLDMGVGENINLVQLERMPPRLRIDHQQEAELAESYMRSFEIDVPHPNFKVRFLSGGNQQKVIVSKWMAAAPHILLCDEPTQGIDIAAKAEIYRLMNELTQQDVGIVMVGNDVTEILHLCDRVLVLRHGRPVCILKTDETDRDTILRYMMKDTHSG